MHSPQVQKSDYAYRIRRMGTGATAGCSEMFEGQLLFFFSFLNAKPFASASTRFSHPSSASLATSPSNKVMHYR